MTLKECNRSITFRFIPETVRRRKAVHQFLMTLGLRISMSLFLEARCQSDTEQLCPTLHGDSFRDAWINTPHLQYREHFPIHTFITPGVVTLSQNHHTLSAGGGRKGGGDHCRFSSRGATSICLKGGNFLGTDANYPRFNSALEKKQNRNNIFVAITATYDLRVLQDVSPMKFLQSWCHHHHHYRWPSTQRPEWIFAIFCNLMDDIS